MFMSRFLPRIITLAPQGASGAGLVSASGRAGALGILDLVSKDRETLSSDLNRTARYALAPFGLRVEADQVEAINFTGLPEKLQTFLCTGDAETDWNLVLPQVRQAGYQVLAEVTTRASARSAFEAGADGVIVSGFEAGGLCSDESSFVLLQGVLADGGGPVWVRGGIGPLAASACLAMGASGVVLDGILLLARESSLSEEIREAIARFDGGEAIVLGPSGKPRLRCWASPRSPALQKLQEAAESGGGAWQKALRTEVGWSNQNAWPVGQEAALAASLARRFVTVGGIIQAVEAAIDRGRDLAGSYRPLAAESPLAISQGTKYPIVQGPMTRVSDSPAFAEAVAENGALPFLALAMLRGEEVRSLLAETAKRLGSRPWGVGVLGFVPPELRFEQVAAIRAIKPPFALIAGGRPDQAQDLEQVGIATYLHAPSPGLLAQYLRDGARRFVLEGRECGGHVGPRSSLVLWEQGVETLLEVIASGTVADPTALQLLFAGGLHDARSAAGVSALAAPLAALGVKVGILIGTAYLFTKEAVETGAIVPRFQAEAVRCQATVLLRSGPGHEVRVAPSPFTEAFEAERKRLVASGEPAERVREALETLNVGRLRVASKGLDRSDAQDSKASMVLLEEARQYERGLYMLGQVATLRDRVTTMANLHQELSEGATALLAPKPTIEAEPIAAEPRPEPSDIAIVGMSAIFPKAGDLRTFWENTLNGLDAIEEIPSDRWDWRTYYDTNPKAPDKITSKWGGFLPDVPIDPLKYGMPPTSLPSIEPAQLLVLETVRKALEDAGYAERAFPRERTAVVLGMGGGAAQLAMGYAFRSYLPMLDTVAPEAGPAARAEAEALLPEWTEDSFPGFLLNVTAGRVANRFNLGGANYTVDAACGSSLAAAALAVRELESKAADLVILGGADTVQNPFTYLAFSKTQAFSPRGRCRPFDASADGIVISEGVGVVVLKRLADAERDGDRIYTVIKGIGASSDGRAKGLTAPCGDGQARALSRAYEKANVSPNTVGYFEAHGTGTAVGDVVEVNSLAEFLKSAGAKSGASVVGSVKSMIGHTKCAAGLAGLINASLALYHRVLPPTIGVEQLNPKADLQDGPLRVNTKARPWLHGTDEEPRRAGVSAFGFGGTNFHAVLEAFENDPTPRPAPLRDGPAELLLWKANDRESLLSTLDRLSTAIEQGARPALRDLAHTLSAQFETCSETDPGPTLAIVASSLDDLKQKLSKARIALAKDQANWSNPQGIFFAERPVYTGEKVAFLFPGQGAQRVEMLGDLALVFDEVRSAFEDFDTTLSKAGRPPIGPKVFPPSMLDSVARERARLELQKTDLAQPAVGAASVGMFRLLGSLGLTPDVVAGHSYGELVALHASGALGLEDLAILSEARGRLMIEAAGPEPGTMAALLAGPDRLASWVEAEENVVLANINGPNQTVLAGPRDDLARVVERARSEGIRCFDLPVGAAFHSPLVAKAREPLARLAADRIQTSPRLPIYSNLDASLHPTDPSAIAQRLGDHLASPVLFSKMIEAMYQDGTRVFIECGPGTILTPLVDQILEDRPHLALACDAPGRPGIPSLLQTIGQLVVAGLNVHARRLTAGRSASRLDLDRLATSKSEPLAPSTWLVNGSRARPLNGPEPKRLGQAPEVLGLDTASKATLTSTTFKTVPKSASNGIHDPVRNGVHTPEVPEPVESRRNSMHAPLSNGHAPAPQASSQDDRAGERSSAPSPALPSSVGGSDRVIEAFQETMRTFLEVQRSTMLAYLSSRGRTPELREETKATNSSPLPRIAFESVPETEPEPESLPKAPEVIAKPDLPDSGRPAGSVADRLVEIVCERTGYPTEMLNLKLDLEADLGIDSIKRVEILGSLRESVKEMESLTESTLMDRLARAKTLGEIVEHVETALSNAQQNIKAHQDIPESIEKPVSANPPKNHPRLRRMLLEAVESPRPGGGLGLAPGGVVLLTDDDRGVASSLVKHLQGEGHPTLLAGAKEVDWTSPALVEQWLKSSCGDRAICGIVHALPLRTMSPVHLDSSAWKLRLNEELKGLFLLAQAAADDLHRSAKRGGSCLIAATALGGSFASTGGFPQGIFPGQGGIAGLVKTLAREWPEVRTRVIDLDSSEPVSTLADRLASEIDVQDGWPEVGYVDGQRIRLQVVERALDREQDPLRIAPGAPILITGGARGITAAVATALARQWRPTLLVVGSSPPPPEFEDSLTAQLSSPSDIKAALLENLQKAGRSVGPADLERAYRAIWQAREMRSSFRKMSEAGATVEYARADVRDFNALEKTLNHWRQRFGNPVGVIHGAGVIHDKLLRDKTPEAFDRVLGTKLKGALHLARLLNPEKLQFFSMFSSIAGRFGNQGQADYAAANEVLNKLGRWLDQQWPGRVLSFNWGPWAGVGMVSELQEHLGRRGLGMIEPNAGCSAFLEEIQFGRKGDVEILISGELGNLEGPLSIQQADPVGVL